MNIQILNSRHIDDLLKNKTKDSLNEYYIICKFFFNTPIENYRPTKDSVYRYIIKDKYYEITYQSKSGHINIELLNLYDEVTRL